MRSVLFRHSIVAVLFVFLLQTLFPVQMAFTQNAAAIRSTFTVFSNSTPITLNTASGLTAPTVSSNYPATINVSGMTGNTTKVEVTIKGITHTMNQVDMLLVSPTGAKFVFLSDSTSPGGNDSFYTFSDSGTTILNNTVSASGTYLPSDNTAGGTDTFPAPAPAGPYSLPPAATFASVFNGADPNGAWNLYAVDDTLFTTGFVVSGWSLNITTNGAPQTFANPNYFSFSDIVAQSTPYGSVINVAGQTGVISNLKVTLSGYSHASSGDVDILLVSPNGQGLTLMSDVASSAVSNINITFDDAASSTINVSPIVTGSYRPTDNSSETDFFPSPAPLRPYLENSSQLNNFYGYNPNGEWRLFIVDDTQINAGSIAGGWSLDITTVPTPPQTPLSCSGPSFAPANFAAGNNPTNLAVADFNNDTKPDVAVTNQAGNDVSVLLGNGSGGMGTPANFPAGTAPYSVVAGNFNADSNVDLAVANSGSNNVSVLIGNGSGGFSAPTNFSAGTSPISIASADFTNDGKLDLAVTNFGGFFFGTVSILIGNGTGGFAAGTPLRTRTQPSFVTSANLNGDGSPDLVVASFGANSVSTFFGNNNGTFVLSQNITTGAGPVSVKLADLGTDGILDLAVANYNGDTFTACTGNAVGVFSFCSINNPAGGTNPISITAGDYVGNGTKAMATALSGSNAVNVFNNNVAVGVFPNAIETADFNSDGKPDMITANSGSNDVSILLNSCSAAKGNLFDYNGDRKTDYSVFRPSTTQYFVQTLNQFGAAKVLGRPNDVLVPADFNGDRKTDFAYYRPESGLWVVQETSSGLGRPIYFLQFGLPEDIPMPADYDGDGKADLAVFRPSDGNWYIRRSTDNALQTIRFGSAGDKPVAADFDGDTIADIAVYRPSTGVWYILRSLDGQFVFRQFGISEDKTVAADYDGDSKADIAVWRPSSAAWYILRSSDDDFRAVAWGLPTDMPVIGDYEGDGKFDYAVWRPSDGTWFIQKSSDGGSIGFQWGISTDKPAPNAFVR